jgi:hypothetical protein
MDVYDTVTADVVESGDTVQFVIPDTDVIEQLVVQRKDDNGNIISLEGNSLVTGDAEFYDLPDDWPVDLLTY